MIFGTSHFHASGLTEQELLPLAAQMGYSFSMDDLKAYGEEVEQANMNRELSDAELEAVSGGETLCVIGGGGDGGVCVIIGYSPHGMCVFVGHTY